MTNFVELVIPIDREWLAMLDVVTLPITQILPPDTSYFFTNDGGKILRLRIEENVFVAHKKEIYQHLLQQLQSDEKVKVYKQNYVLEQARFGVPQNINIHTKLFHAASEIVIHLLEEAEHIENYENRMPYAVIAIHYLLSALDKSQAADLTTLYMQHWMYFNEQNNLEALIKSYQQTYADEVSSLRNLLGTIDQNITLKDLFSDWKKACLDFVEALKSNEVVTGFEARQKEYFYTNNSLAHARKWEVVADHIHLLLNRLGIQNEDETLLVYLSYSAMK